ncbi:MAG: glycosyltransferase [Alphaproteobacteria bacterium]|nr:glycosyltransferase [Alphaproteobacteria bacterium]
MVATKTMPLISVILPVYNAEKFLHICLEYLTHQTYQNLEFIIVDDGSTDNTPNIYNKYAGRDTRFKIIRQENSGPANARNRGLGMARGEYVHFHDCDDFVELDYYEKMVVAINQSEADIICGEVNEPGYMFPDFNRVQILATLEDKIIVPKAHLFHVVWRYVYRREFLSEHKLQYPTNMFIGEDTMFMMRTTYYARTIATAPGAVYHCVSVPTSLGKNAGKIMRGRANGDAREHSEYAKFMEQSGMAQILNQINRGKIVGRTRYEFLKIPFFMKKYYSNGDIKYYVLNIPLFMRRQTHNRIQIFICGIYVFRKYTRGV